MVFCYVLKKTSGHLVLMRDYFPTKIIFMLIHFKRDCFILFSLINKNKRRERAREYSTVLKGCDDFYENVKSSSDKVDYSQGGKNLRHLC